jgi:DNA invertase Pin-like site-specific DNA recombinase
MHIERFFVPGLAHASYLVAADTTSHTGKLIMTVFAGIAEFEHALIRERTSAGRVVAKQRGVRFGRPQKLNAEQCTLALRLLDEGESVNEVAKSFKVHGSTIRDHQVPG